MPNTILSVQNLRLAFETIQGRFNVLNGVDLIINQGEVVGLVGESGCGKSSLGLAIIGLLPTESIRIDKVSKVLFKGQDLLSLNEREIEMIRGTGIGMIFQEPLTSLNPVFRIGDQLNESITIERERDQTKRSASKLNYEEQVSNWLKKVGIPDSKIAHRKYPHELSGGMRQRVMIAMAMSEKPSLLLADEPTSALDVTTQAQILNLMKSLIEDVGTSVLFISHDLAVVAQIADRVAVMYAGAVVEEAPVLEIFERPLHPYTQALLASFPSDRNKNKRLQVVTGSVASLMNLPSGCPFHPRCKFATKECAIEVPKMKETSNGHRVACILY
jgi:oligopeptide/dipeptide ABC transporter ATP-binding protein